ncbi:hypothetical protein SEA_STEAMY_60 [Mycobacterium phage Steamy]|uniref:Uncharacterized protein n=1 Tax=Mycobacterium phage Steamy TaxID=2250309 RepID=A0A345L0N2_9CAUD|nr:hypothetical protein KIV62_gp41 [Mycobacterium phage Steamy]AXH48834.1 hypothetical protein SEA_STEAMY_60 [Mycobacterium phage Steamy]
MNVSFKVLGFEIWSLELDLGEPEAPVNTPVEKATKAMSRWWVKRMVT